VAELGSGVAAAVVARGVVPADVGCGASAAFAELKIAETILSKMLIFSALS
jgi:hypothetical protein